MRRAIRSEWAREQLTCKARHSTANTEHTKMKYVLYSNRNPAQTQNQASALRSLFRANTDKWCSLFIFIFVPPRIYPLLIVSLLLRLSLALATCDECACVCMCVRVCVGSVSYRCRQKVQRYSFIEKKNSLANLLSNEQTSAVLDSTSTSFFDTYIAHTRTKGKHMCAGRIQMLWYQCTSTQNYSHWMRLLLLLMMFRE